MCLWHIEINSWMWQNLQYVILFYNQNLISQLPERTMAWLHSGIHCFSSGDVQASLNTLVGWEWMVALIQSTTAALESGISALYFQNGQEARACTGGHCLRHDSFPKVRSWGDMMRHVSQAHYDWKYSWDSVPLWSIQEYTLVPSHLVMLGVEATNFYALNFEFPSSHPFWWFPWNLFSLGLFSDEYFTFLDGDLMQPCGSGSRSSIRHMTYASP